MSFCFEIPTDSKTKAYVFSFASFVETFLIFFKRNETFSRGFLWKLHVISKCWKLPITGAYSRKLGLTIVVLFYFIMSCLRCIMYVEANTKVLHISRQILNPLFLTKIAKVTNLVLAKIHYGNWILLRETTWNHVKPSFYRIFSNLTVVSAINLKVFKEKLKISKEIGGASKTKTFRYKGQKLM